MRCVCLRGSGAGSAGIEVKGGRGHCSGGVATAVMVMIR